MNEAISDAVAGAALGLIPEREARHAVAIRMGKGERVDTKTIEPVLRDDAGRR